MVQRQRVSDVGTIDTDIDKEVQLGDDCGGGGVENVCIETSILSDEDGAIDVGSIGKGSVERCSRIGAGGDSMGSSWKAGVIDTADEDGDC